MQRSGGGSEADGDPRVGSEVRRARKNRGLTTRELARRIGASQPYVSNVENGHIFPSIRTLGLLAEALEVDPAQLLPPRPRSERVSGAVGMRPRSSGEGASRPVLSRTERDVEVYRVELGPLEAEPRPFVHDEEDFVYVLSGQLELRREGVAPMVMAAGESAWVDGRTPHRLAGTSQGGGVALVFSARHVRPGEPAHA